MKGTVLIVGLGLIGGSLALIIKDTYPKAHIIGLDLSQHALKKGKMLGIIDEIGESLQVNAPMADLIIFCSPVKETEKLICSLEKVQLKRNVIVTDAGSTKEKIVEAARPLVKAGITFIGGHPMAGSHKSGILAAKRMLFENAYYLLTPTPETKESELSTLKKWLVGTKAKFLTLTAPEHDEITGTLSHMPHIIASALVNQTDDFAKKHPTAHLLAAGGFRDITRIASADPHMWTDISLSNRHTLIDQLTNWRDAMDATLAMLNRAQFLEIHQFFERAKKFRDSIPLETSGTIPAFYDLFIEIPDYPGAISEITAYLAKENISLTNIKILEIRENIDGVLRLSFQTNKDRKKAKHCLEKSNKYIIYME